MKITFSNLGTIKKTELDLRPLTVIIGPNNTSKTYVAYSVYGLCKFSTEYEQTPPPRQKLHFDKTTVSLALDDEFIAKFADELKVTHSLFQGELDSYFQDSSHRIFENTTFDLKIEPDAIRDAVAYAASQELAPESSGVVRASRVTLHGVARSQRPLAAMLVDRLLSLARRHIFPKPFLLPAERNAFVITYKMLANRRFRLLREGQRELLGRRKVAAREMDLMREQDNIRYPLPIEDFLDFLTDVELSDSAAPPDPQHRNPFQKLADDIEVKIQNNNKIRLIPTKLGGREIKVNVKRGLSIDLYNASSSIKQLAPLLLYLRYRAKPDHLLIIDEPEMNLHPESQAKLLEVLGVLVNLGVKVLLTTHSHYFMAHLNNLVAGDMRNPDVRKRQATSLYLGDERAFLAMDQVSAYEMKDGKLCSLKDKDYGIRWDTLSDVSGELQQKFFQISGE